MRKKNLRLPSRRFWHQKDMSISSLDPASSFGYGLGTPPEPSPRPIKEPPDPLENPDAPVREPDPNQPAQM
jgi:hypothetical protein